MSVFGRSGPTHRRIRVLAVAGVIAAGVVLPGRAPAQEVELLVPAGTPVESASDTVVVTGTQAGTAWLDLACGAEGGEYPLDIVAAADGRLFGAVVLGAVQTGSRVSGLTLLGPCTGGGTLYQRFRGVLE